MPLSRTHKIALLVALIGAAATITAALLSNSGNSSNITQTGSGNNICANNSQCTQGH